MTTVEPCPQRTGTPESSVDADRWPALAPQGPEGRASRVRSRIARSLVLAAMRRTAVRVVPADGRPFGGGGPDAPTMHLHRPAEFYRRVGADGLIGFGESYMAGDWDAEDLAGFLTVLCRRIDVLVPRPLQRLRGLYVARHPASERNTATQTRDNIARHYDLSNELFATFLDPTMTYSAALFGDGTQPAGSQVNTAVAPGTPTAADLPAAQRRKLDRLLDEAGVGEGTRLLEIGTGWGELCLRAAARGARVRSITLSAEQQRLARERVAAAGYADRVEIDLIDYRQVEGSYDAVVSVEMIEAVGEEYLPSYFGTIERLLVPGGHAAIQAITMPHERMLATRGTYTWIHKYVFPGGFLPSVEQLEQTTAGTALRLTGRLSMGRHYAETLRLWSEEFEARAAEVWAQGFDRVFARMWHFYLAYSRAGFAADYLDVNQLTFVRDTDSGEGRDSARLDL